MGRRVPSKKAKHTQTHIHAHSKRFVWPNVTGKSNADNKSTCDLENVSTQAPAAVQHPLLRGSLPGVDQEHLKPSWSVQ